MKFNINILVEGQWVLSQENREAKSRRQLMKMVKKEMAELDEPRKIGTYSVCPVLE